MARTKRWTKQAVKDSTIDLLVLLISIAVMFGVVAGCIGMMKLFEVMIGG